MTLQTSRETAVCARRRVTDVAYNLTALGLSMSRTAWRILTLLVNIYVARTSAFSFTHLHLRKFGAAPSQTCTRPAAGFRSPFDVHLPFQMSAQGMGTFKPVSIVNPSDDGSELFCVVASDDEAAEEDIVIQPGLGWGEGEHPSTYLCLQFTSDQVAAKDSPTFLDYGTGSGVLAICAKKFGAGRVVGIDKDDEILDHARENARLNNMEDVEFLNGRELMPSSSGLYIADAFSAVTFDVVCANMLPAALCKLASFISLGVKEDTGVLGLSGIRHEQVDVVKASFAKHGIVFETERRREGAAPGAEWTEYVLLTGRRPRRSEEEQRAYAAFLAESAVT